MATQCRKDMTNKKLGNDFESAFCEILFEKGFWCHNLAQNQAGQPADVIAVRNGKSYLIDCKVCCNRGFALSRVEENQNQSMDLWKSCGNGVGWFAMLLPGDSIYMVSHAYLKIVSREKSTISSIEIAKNGVGLNEWVEMTERKNNYEEHEH